MPSDPTPPRGNRRDAVATRAELLQAALAEFSAFGFEGGRVDRIAAAAGVNKQLVYYYFGSKSDLYRCALEHVYAEIRTAERELHLADLPPVEAMRVLVGFSFDYLDKHPEFIKILGDENRMGAPHVSRSDQLAEMHSPLVAMVGETMARGVAAGQFHDRFDPVNLYMSIAALGFFYFANRPTLSAIFDRDLTTPAQVALRRQHAVDLVLLSLRPEG